MPPEGDHDTDMATPGEPATHYESSPGDLSSPPSGSLSDPQTPSRRASASGRPKKNTGEIVVGSEQRAQQSAGGNYIYDPVPQKQQDQEVEERPVFTKYQTQTAPGGFQRRYGLLNGKTWVQVTMSGLPRKKPGRKPGYVVSKDPQAKTKTKPPRDPKAPPAQRKRKLAPGASDAAAAESPSAPASRLPPSASSAAALYVGRTDASLVPTAADLGFPTSRSIRLPPTRPPEQRPQPEHTYSPKIPEREAGYPGSMQNILNAAPPPTQLRSPGSAATTAIPVRSSGQSYDPIRGNYDPVRSSMMSNNSYSPTPTSGSPRAPTLQPTNRSPSIASLLDSRGPSGTSPHLPHRGYQPAPTQSRFEEEDESTFVPPSPPSPTRAPRPVPHVPAPSKEPAPEPKKDRPRAPLPAAPRPVVRESQLTTIANGPVRKVSDKQKTSTGGMSTPLSDTLDDAPQEGEGRSILDFGRARPGEEAQAPTISLSIPITSGETNKYVNFMRLAEERYGWDALHPRLAANRDRKERIAAAAASLDKVDSGRDESGEDEMSVDLSDAEGSNPENGGTSNPDAQASKPKKKRLFKEDQYDVGDDFVDDSELLWEAQAAASRDGFFVYSGPLVPEPEEPAADHEERPKRGRGGRGSRGGGRGTTRGATGTGRGGGPGSRGGTVTRKPRITKSEKLQREREKAERESLAQMGRAGSGSGTVGLGNGVQPPTPSFVVRELGA